MPHLKMTMQFASHTHFRILLGDPHSNSTILWGTSLPVGLPLPISQQKFSRNRPESRGHVFPSLYIHISTFICALKTWHCDLRERNNRVRSRARLWGSSISVAFFK